MKVMPMGTLALVANVLRSGRTSLGRWREQTPILRVSVGTVAELTRVVRTSWPTAELPG